MFKSIHTCALGTHFLYIKHAQMYACTHAYTLEHACVRTYPRVYMDACMHSHPFIHTYTGTCIRVCFPVQNQNNNTSKKCFLIIKASIYALNFLIVFPEKKHLISGKFYCIENQEVEENIWFWTPVKVVNNNFDNKIYYCP